jgi:hypothetical protein
MNAKGAQGFYNALLSCIPFLAVGYEGTLNHRSLRSRLDATGVGRRPDAARIIESGAYSGCNLSMSTHRTDPRRWTSSIRKGYCVDGPQRNVGATANRSLYRHLERRLLTPLDTTGTVEQDRKNRPAPFFKLRNELRTQAARHERVRSSL